MKRGKNHLPPVGLPPGKNVTPPAKEHTKSVENPHKKATHADKKTEPEHQEAFDWTRVIILITVVNGILIIGGVGGYIYWRKRKKKLQAQEQEEMDL